LFNERLLNRRKWLTFFKYTQQCVDNWSDRFRQLFRTPVPDQPSGPAWSTLWAQLSEALLQRYQDTPEVAKLVHMFGTVDIFIAHCRHTGFPFCAASASLMVRHFDAMLLILPDVPDIDDICFGTVLAAVSKQDLMVIGFCNPNATAAATAVEAAVDMDTDASPYQPREFARLGVEGNRVLPAQPDDDGLFLWPARRDLPVNWCTVPHQVYSLWPADRYEPSQAAIIVPLHLFLSVNKIPQHIFRETDEAETQDVDPHHAETDDVAAPELDWQPSRNRVQADSSPSQEESDAAAGQQPYMEAARFLDRDNLYRPSPFLATAQLPSRRPAQVPWTEFAASPGTFLAEVRARIHVSRGI
jgi:hypothetical protein